MVLPKTKVITDSNIYNNCIINQIAAVCPPQPTLLVFIVAYWIILFNRKIAKYILLLLFIIEHSQRMILEDHIINRINIYTS